MKDLDNLPDAEPGQNFGLLAFKIVLGTVLVAAVAGAGFLFWKKTRTVQRDAVSENIPIPVIKTNPEPDLTFYKNLKEKDENSAKKERLVGLMPPSRLPGGAGDMAVAEPSKELSPANRIVASRYTLQLASMKDNEKARRLSEKLKRKGFPSYVIPAKIPERGIYYRVRVGHYVTRKAAEEALEELKRKGENEGMIAKENVITQARK